MFIFFSFFDEVYNNVCVVVLLFFFNVFIVVWQLGSVLVSGLVLLEEDQVEFVVVVVEVIGQEDKLVEVLYGMLLVFGYLVYGIFLDGEFVDLLRVFDV